MLFKNTWRGIKDDFRMIKHRVLNYLKRRGKTVCYSLGYGVNTYWIKSGKWRVCQHCGSMHHEDLLIELEKDPSIVERSTKDYKWYVRLPGVRNASEGPIKFYKWHLSVGTEELINTFRHKAAEGK